MPPECVLAKSSEIADLDLMTITADDLNVRLYEKGRLY